MIAALRTTTASLLGMNGAATSRGNLLERLHFPASPRQLAVLRIVVALDILYAYSSWSIPIARAVGFGPNPGLRGYVPVPTTVTALEWLCWVVILGTVFLLVGFKTRLAAFVTLIPYLITQCHYYRQLNHHDGWPYLVTTLLVLGMSRSGDALSVDRWLRGPPRLPPLQPGDPGPYRWPLEALTLWFATLYVCAGLSKLMPLRKGIVWLSGDSIRWLIVDRYYDSPVQWILGRPLFDYELAFPFRMAALSTVVVECLPIALLFTRRLHVPVLIAVAGLHTVIYAFGVPGFLWTSLAVGVVLLPEGWFGAPVGGAPGPEGPAGTPSGITGLAGTPDPSDVGAVHVRSAIAEGANGP